MIELIHKPDNVTLKGNGYSLFEEIQGLPIKIIHEDYYGFRVRQPLLDPLAGGLVHIILENDEYWTFKVTGIDVGTINELKDAQIRLIRESPWQPNRKLAYSIHEKLLTLQNENERAT